MKKFLLAVLTALTLAAMSLFVACGDTKDNKGKSTPSLDSPVITLDGAIVSWNAVEHASSYEVVVNSGTPVSVQTTSYTVVATEIGEYKITVTAISDSNKFKDSAPSNQVTYVVAANKLDKPALSLSGKTVTWQIIPNASSYDVYVNDVKAVTQIETEYTIATNNVGTYKIQVVAISSNALYTSSDKSDAVNYTVESTLLSPPVLTIDGNVVSWDAVPNAQSYEVFVNDRSVGKQSELTYEVTETAVGKYFVAVKAIAGSALYRDSGASYSVLYIVTIKLDAPELTVEGNVVSWDDVNNATGYEVYVDGAKRTETEQTTFTLADRENDSYTVTVKSISTDDTYSTSDASNSVEIVVRTKLAAPQTTENEGVIEWEAVENAHSYDVYINGIKKDAVTETVYTLAETVANKYEITVVAVPSDDDYAPSTASAPIYKTVFGKIAEYTFDEQDVADSSGNGYDGEIFGGATFVDGVSGKALSLDGNGQYAELPAVVDGCDALTIAAWVYLNGNTNDYARLCEFADREGKSLRIYPDTIGATSAQIAELSELKTNFWTVGAKADAGVWTHIVLTMDGAHGRLYINGQLLGWLDNMEFGLDFLGHTVQNYIGRSAYSDADPYLNGKVDEFIVYNYALTQSEITAILASYKTELAPPSIELDGMTVSWSAVEKATEYAVYVNGELVATTDKLSYTVTEFKSQTNVVTVVAVGDGLLYSNSAASNGQTINITVLDMPVVAVADKTLTWQAVEDAAEYDVYVNGEMVATTEQTTYVLTATKAGKYSVAVKAVSNDDGVLDSALSDSVEIIVKGKLVEYKFEDNANDSSGNGFNGEANSALSYADGKDGKAVSLDGTQFISLPDFGITNYDAVTVSAWVNVSKAQFWARLLDIKDTAGNYIIIVPVHSDGNLVIQDNGGPMWYTALPLNEWVHLTVVLDGANTKIYVNGNLVAVGNAGFGKKPSDLGTIESIYIGKAFDEDSQHTARLEALVDEFTIYNYALTAEEISAEVGAA